MALSLHPPFSMHLLTAHAGHHLVQLARQTFLFSKPWQVADMVDEHPAVNGHGSTNRIVRLQGANDGREVAGKQPLHGIGGRFEALTVGLVNEGFRNKFGKTPEFGNGVGRGEKTRLLFSLERFKHVFGIRSTEHDVFLSSLGEVANDAATTNKAMSNWRFPSTDVG